MSLVPNRPLLSFKNPHFQNEAERKAFLVMSFICMRLKNHFHINGFALSLAFKQRSRSTQKWPIIHQAPVVQKVDSAIHIINLYPVDSAIGFPNTYSVDSDLSSG